MTQTNELEGKMATREQSDKTVRVVVTVMLLLLYFLGAVGCINRVKDTPETRTTFEHSIKLSPKRQISITGVEGYTTSVGIHARAKEPFGIYVVENGETVAALTSTNYSPNITLYEHRLFHAFSLNEGETVVLEGVVSSSLLEIKSIENTGPFRIDYKTYHYLGLSIFLINFGLLLVVHSPLIVRHGWKEGLRRAWQQTW